jgi:hypothetical protein
LALLPERWIVDKKGVKLISEFFVRRLAILKFGSLNALKNHLSLLGIDLNPAKDDIGKVRQKRKRQAEIDDLEDQKKVEEDSTMRRSSRLSKKPKLHYHDPTEEELMMELEELLPSVPMEL